MSSKNIELPANPADVLASLLKFHTQRHPATDKRDLLMLALSLLQVSQRLNSDDKTELSAVGHTIRALSSLRLADMHFPIMPTLLSRKYTELLEHYDISQEHRPQVLLEGVLTFLNIAQADPAHATESALFSVVRAIAEQFPKKAIPYPKTNYRAALSKIFNPGNAAAVDMTPLSVIVYRGELIGGGFGPELWGLAYVKDASAHLLLETGEYIAVPANSLTLAIAYDYDASELPPYLLACAQLFLPHLFSRLYDHEIPQELQIQLDTVLKQLGTFTTAVATDFVPITAISACDNVLIGARWAHDNAQTAEAIKTLALSRGCVAVTITAQQAAIRPYITAVLAQTATNEVLLRLDTPREFSARGIYFFPAADKSSALIVL